MFDLLLTSLALLLIGVLALACVGVLLTPAYFWVLWRDSERAAQARAADGIQ